MVSAVTLWMAIVVVLMQPAAAQDSVTVAPSAAQRTGGLVMDVQGEADASGKRVAVTVKPNGQTESVSGAADVIGFPFIETGPWADVDWKIDGAQITGLLKRKDGTVEGTFEGTITVTGVSGKFTHSDGRVGLWSWDGPPPQPATSDGN